MVGLYILAEGETEQTFVSEVLRPHLNGVGIDFTVAQLPRGQGMKGGMFGKYAPLRAVLQKMIKTNQRQGVWFTTMIDLYRLPKDFPGQAQSETMRHLPAKQRVEFLETQFARDMSSPNFIPYLQLHEFEAIVLSEPEKLSAYYGPVDRRIRQLRTMVDSFDSPEDINDGPNTFPSKRIKDQFPDYKKLLAGVKAAELIGLSTIRSKCPHFDAWLTRLEGLGGPRA